MAQQLPLALVLFMLGGLPWVVWGIAVRISVSLTGHWLVGHFAHRDGHQGWSVDDVAVQGYNLPHFEAGDLRRGFPRQPPRLSGFRPARHRTGPVGHRLQYFIRLLARLGLASAIKLPHTIVCQGEVEARQRIRNLC